MWQGACVAGGIRGRGVHGGGGGMHGRGMCVAGLGACVIGNTATAADGTHPTGMLSCVWCSLIFAFCTIQILTLKHKRNVIITYTAPRSSAMDMKESRSAPEYPLIDSTQPSKGVQPGLCTTGVNSSLSVSGSSASSSMHDCCERKNNLRLLWPINNKMQIALLK